MRKPAKPRKAAKLAVPADQVMLKTQCEICRDVFTNPTTAADHVAKEHADGNA